MGNHHFETTYLIFIDVFLWERSPEGVGNGLLLGGKESVAVFLEPIGHDAQFAIPKGQIHTNIRGVRLDPCKIFVQYTRGHHACCEDSVVEDVSAINRTIAVTEVIFKRIARIGTHHTI